MLTQAVLATLRILIFRAGPEDFPFDTTPRMTRICAFFALASSAAMAAVIVNPVAAVISAALYIGLLALITRATLAARKLQNRFQQTFNALMTTFGVLNFAMLPFFAQIAPMLLEFAQNVQKNPDLVNHVEQWPHFPPVADNLLGIIGLWQMAVIAYIFYRAAGGRAVFILVMLMLGLMLFMGFSAGGGAAAGPLV